MNNIKSPILQGLFLVKNKDSIRFHMPGHKGKDLDYFKPLVENLFSLDFTEINGTDDLYNSSSIIKEAIELLTNERKSKYSFFLTNGTTVGILASILALTKQADQILIPKDSHKSVYNAIELNKLHPIIIDNIVADSGLIYPIDEDILLKTLKENTSIRMVVLSRPNYYGLCSKIDKIASYCYDNNIILLIDEAHGSHLAYHNNFPKNGLSQGASITVNSFHKTLSSFTQTSVINFGENISIVDMAKVLNYIEKLQSSSPSYLMLASLDLTRAYIEENGLSGYKALEENILDFYQSISHLSWIKIPKYPNIYDKDFSRIILETSIPAIFVQQYLEDNNIFIEMISKNILVLISSIEDTKEDFTKLSTVLNRFDPSLNYDLKKTSKNENFIRNNNTLPLYECEGKVLHENIIIYPPGYYYLKIGDIITLENINYIDDLLNSGINVYTDLNKDIYNLYVLDPLEDIN